MTPIPDNINFCYVCRDRIVFENNTEVDKKIYVCSMKCFSKYYDLLSELTKKLSQIKHRSKTPTPEG